MVSLPRAKRPVEDIAASSLHNRHSLVSAGGTCIGCALEAMMEEEDSVFQQATADAA